MQLVNSMFFFEHHPKLDKLNTMLVYTANWVILYITYLPPMKGTKNNQPLTSEVFLLSNFRPS